MGSVTGFTAAHQTALAAEDIIGGAVVGNNLILTKRGGGTINAGNVRGIQGIKGDTGDVSTAELNAAVTAINDRAGLGILQIKEVGTEQFIPGFSADTWKDITGLSWAHTYTPGRYLEVAFQVSLKTPDGFGSDFDVRVIRVGGAEVCGSSGMVRRADHSIVVNGSRKFEVPGTWTGSQTLKVQVRYATDHHVYVTSDVSIGVLTFQDLGKS